MQLLALNYLYLAICIVCTINYMQAVLCGALSETLESAGGGQQVSLETDNQSFHGVSFCRNDYTQLEDDYKRYITLVEDSCEKMMAAQNSRRSKDWSASDKNPPKSGKSEDSRMFRQDSYI